MDDQYKLSALQRVVLVEESGTRVVLATHVTLEHATAILEALRGVCPFKSIEIVPEPILESQPRSVPED